MSVGPAGSIVSSSEDVQETHGIAVDAEMQFTDSSRTLAGLSYEVDSQIADKATTTPFGPPTLRYSDAEIRTWSAFAQHEMDFTDALTGTFGLRYYSVDSSLDTYTVNGVDEPKNPNDDSRLLGSIGLTYKPTEDVTWRANISQGYTYPTFSQLYLETTAGGGGGVTEGNPDLKPESATTYEIGLRMDRGNAVFDGTLFYADAKDYISTQTIGAGPNATYVNVNKAQSYGLEVAAEFDTDLWGLRPYVNATWMKREFTYATPTGPYSTFDSGTPELSATIGVRRDWELGGFGGEWDLYATGESGSVTRNSAGAVTSDVGGYGTLNARITADITDAVAVSFEANNLFDRSYEVRDQYEGAGRNFSLFLTARF